MHCAHRVQQDPGLEGSEGGKESASKSKGHLGVWSSGMS